MSYRDDGEALLQRAEALERELEQVKTEAAAHKAEATQLRADADAEEAAEDAEDARALTVVPPRPAVVIAGPDPSERYLAGVVGIGWTLLALAAGGAWWMVPSALVTAYGAGWILRWVRSRRIERTALAPWRHLPVDEDAYRKLMTSSRRSVVVRIDVTFEWALASGDRERVHRKLTGVGAIGREGPALTISSQRLRTKRSRGGAKEWDFDPEPIRAFCDAAFTRLVAVDEIHPIATIRLYARSR